MEKTTGIKSATAASLGRTGGSPARLPARAIHTAPTAIRQLDYGGLFCDTITVRSGRPAGRPLTDPRESVKGKFTPPIPATVRGTTGRLGQQMVPPSGRQIERL